MNIYFKFAKKIICLSVIFTLVLIVCPGCNFSGQDGSHGANETTPAKPDHSRITVGAYFNQDKNPLAIKTSYNEQMSFLIYDGLYYLNANYEATDNLANSYEIQNGGHTVLITVKPNVSFHDGSPLTAHDVRATIQYLLETPGYYQYNVRNIQSVSVVDELTVQLELSYLTPNLKQQLTFPVVCKKELLNTSNFQYNGTGPYRLASETTGKQLLLELNENYHREFQSDISEIEVALMPDVKTARSLSASGILDIFYSSFYEEGLKTVTKYESNKCDYISDEYTFLAFNYNVPAMNEKSFRRALYQIIDRDAIRDDIFMTHAESAYLPLPPGSWAYNQNKENVRNTDSAKLLLSELGYSDPDNNGILEIYEEDNKKELILDLLSMEDPIKKEICDMLVANFKEIGISLKVHYVPKEEFLAKYEEKIHDLYLMTTNIGYDMNLEPFFNGIFGTPLPIDYGAYLKKFAVSDELAVKQPEYMRLCDEFYEYVPHIPLVFLKHTMLTSHKLAPVSTINPGYFYYEILNQ